MDADTPSSSARELQDAAADVARISAYKPTKAERRLNNLGAPSIRRYLCVMTYGNEGLSLYANRPVGNTVSSVVGSPYAPNTQNPDAAAALSLVKRDVSSLAETSKVILSVLDKVAKAHPITEGECTSLS